MSRYLRENNLPLPSETIPDWCGRDYGDEDAICVWCGEPGADDEFGVHCLAVHSDCREDYHRSVAPEDFCPTCEQYSCRGPKNKCDCPEET